MRAINVLLSVLVSLLLGLLAFEGGLRLIGMGPPDTLNRFDPHTGWSKKPNHEFERHGEEFGTVVFRTNALGLRDDPMDSPAKPDGVFRVLCLGDSFTLGYTVNREDLFVDLLERRWREEGRDVEVLNVGTEGWSTDQEVAWLEAYGAEYEPDLVLVLPYDNDVFWCGQSSYTAYPKPMYSATGTLETGELEDTSRTWRTRTAIGRLVAGAPEPPTFVTSGGRRLPGDFSALLTDPPPLLGDASERARGALAALERTAAELGAKLVVAPIPSNASVDTAFARRFGQDVLRLSDGEWSADRALEFYLEACGDLGIRALDARPTMRAAHAREACYLDYFGPDREWHFNPAGNRAFAELLYASLSGDLPPADPDAQLALSTLDGDHEDESGLPGWLQLYLLLFVLLTGLYYGHYRDEAVWLPPLKVGAILALVFAIFIGVATGVETLSRVSPFLSQLVLVLLIGGVLAFVAWKLGDRLATIAELIKAFTLRGHWYLMPLVVVLLTIGSLLVVAASSPLVAPFIYTLF